MSYMKEPRTVWTDRCVPADPAFAARMVTRVDMDELLQNIHERSYVRHVLAHHIETNNLQRVAMLRQKHGT